MQFFKGLITGIIGLYITTYFYKTATYPNADTSDFIAYSFSKALPSIIVIACASLGICLIIGSFYWFRNNSKKIAEDEIDRARDRAAEIKSEAHSSAAEFRKDNENTCYRLRMEAETLHAAAKEKYDTIDEQERTLKEHYAQLVSELESSYAGKKSAYTVEIRGLVKKNEKLQSDFLNMMIQYKGALKNNGIASIAGKYDKRAKKTLAATHYSTPGTENILRGHEPWADTPPQPV